jgi:uncharacterized glyoxalase superfamily protein PhnB
MPARLRTPALPLPRANADAVVHAALMDGDALLMGADALSEGGEIQAPLEETFATAFGMCTDRFGIPWMVVLEAPVE